MTENTSGAGRHYFERRYFELVAGGTSALAATAAILTRNPDMTALATGIVAAYLMVDGLIGIYGDAGE